MVNSKLLTDYNESIEQYKGDGDFRKLQKNADLFGHLYWENRSRRNYAADLWYNHNRNEICLDLTKDMARGKRVLSIGGGGWVEKEFVDQLQAREVVRTDYIGNEKEGVIEADASSLPFPPESFDMVVSRDMIEHVLDDQVVFAEIKRVLVPDGLLLITTPNGYHQAIDGVIHRRAYTPETFLRELQQQGFKTIAKAGNIPYILTALLPISYEGFALALDEFKRTDARTRGYKHLYYIGTQLFVLARKWLA